LRALTSAAFSLARRSAASARARNAAGGREFVSFCASCGSQSEHIVSLFMAAYPLVAFLSQYYIYIMIGDRLKETKTS